MATICTNDVEFLSPTEFLNYFVYIKWIENDRQGYSNPGSLTFYIPSLLFRKNFKAGETDRETGKHQSLLMV